MLKLTRCVLKLGNVLNWLVGLTSITILSYSFFAADRFKEFFDYKAEYPNYNSEEIHTIFNVDRWDMAIIIITMPLIHIIFTRLISMINDFKDGDVFSIINSKSLRLIALLLLAMNVIYMVYGWFWTTTFESMTKIDLWGPSPTFIEWFAVLLIFVLAEIFKQGAVMRDDLEGTV